MEQENICRLCLNITKQEFGVIDAATRQMLEILSLKVNLDASKSPIVCQDCGEITKNSYFFKSTCINTDDRINAYSATKEKATFDIKDVYVDKKHIIITNNHLVCHFCINLIEKGSCVSVDVFMKNTMYVEMLPVLMPKMSLDFIKDAVICTLCQKNLECYFKFAHKCLYIEEKLDKYRQSEGISITSQIKLSNVLNFLSKDASVYPETTVIKQEITNEDVVDNSNYKVKVEEPLHIKDEDDFEHQSFEASICTNDAEEVYKCGICTFKSKYKYNIKTHRLIHKDISEVQMYKCGICTFETRHKNCLNKHMLTHKNASEVKMYKCKICTFESKYKRCLKSHSLIHKDVSEVEMYKCEICPYKSKQKKNLNSHMLIHKNTSEIEMHKCGQCTFETKYKRCLKSHMLIHMDKSEIEMHRCEICAYETKYKQDLKSHMQVHKDISKVKMFKCGICTYETRYRSCFRSHIIIHKDTSEVEMHKCDQCTYETKWKNCLTKHMIVHKNRTEVEMYRCETCAHETKYKTNMKNHMLKHKNRSELEMYNCGICVYKSISKKYLKNHMLVHKFTSVKNALV